MANLLLEADIVDKGLKLTAVVLGAAGVGHTLAVSAGFFSDKSREEVEKWGTIGTSVGCLIGLLLMVLWVSIAGLD